MIETTKYFIEQLEVYGDTEELAEELDLFCEHDHLSENLKYFLKESAIHMRGLDELFRKAVRALEVKDRLLKEKNSGG